MTRTFQFTQEETKLVNRTHTEFHYAYGCTMAEWASIEQHLYYWFARLTRMRDGMARAIFYSARAFNGRAEMLQVAIEHAYGIPAIDLEFLREALKRAWAYSEFRNRMAHGQVLMNMLEIAGQPRKIDYLIVQGKKLTGPTASDISIDDLSTATGNFYALHLYLLEMLPGFNPPDKKSPEQYLELVRALPSLANSRVAQTPSERGTPDQPPVHRNKKAERAAREAKKRGENP